MISLCLCCHLLDVPFRRNDDSGKMDGSQEIKESQEEANNDQGEVKESSQGEEVKECSQEETKESQEEIKGSGPIINAMEEETTEAVKTGRKAKTRREAKKDASDDQPTGKVLVSY